MDDIIAKRTGQPLQAFRDRKRKRDTTASEAESSIDGMVSSEKEDELGGVGESMEEITEEVADSDRG